MNIRRTGTNSSHELRNGNDNLLLALAGIVTGIALLYNRLSMLAIPVLIFTATLRPGRKRNTLLFSCFMLTGMFSAFLNIRIPANHASTFGPVLEQAEVTVLAANRRAFATHYIVNINRIHCPQQGALRTTGKALLRTNEREYSHFRKGTRLLAQHMATEEIPPPGNPGEFNYRLFMNRRGISLQARAASLTAMESSRYGYRAVFHRARAFLLQKTALAFQYFPEEQALIETLSTGKENIPVFLRTAGIRSGTYHLMVISGLHVGFLLLVLKIGFIPLSGLNNAHPKLFPLVAMLATWFYAGITGFRLPVTRAVLMLSFFNAGELMERDISGPQSIMAAAILLLAINPYTLFDASFQLSFAATAGVVLVFRRFHKEGNPLVYSLAMSGFAAQAAVLPLLLFHFGVFYPAGIVNNLLFLPLTGIIFMLSLLFFFVPLLGAPLKIAAAIFLRGIMLSAAFSPALYLNPSGYTVIAFYAAVLLAFYRPRRRNTTLMLASVCAGMIVLNIAGMAIRYRTTPNAAYFFSFSKPSVLFLSGNSAVAFMAGSYKTLEPDMSLIPFAKSLGYTKRPFDLFYTDARCPLPGTAKRLKSSGLRIRNIYSHAELSARQPGSDMQGINAGDANTLVNGQKVLTGDMQIEILHHDKASGSTSYAIRKNNVSILLSPLACDAVASIVRDRRFTVAFIGDIQTTAQNRRRMGEMQCLYLIIPDNYKKFETLQPELATFYMNKETVVLDFAKCPFDISYLSNTW